MISSDDRVIDHIGKEESLWHGAERSAELERAAGAPVYVMPADELLRRCLKQMKNPFNFAATCYSTSALPGRRGIRRGPPD